MHSLLLKHIRLKSEFGCHSSESVQHFDLETLIKREEKCGRLVGISPTFVDVDHFFEAQGR